MPFLRHKSRLPLAWECFHSLSLFVFDRYYFILMALYSIRSERLLAEQLRYNFLYRWFLDMNLDEEPFDHSIFSKNQQRLEEHGVNELFFGLVVEEARLQGWVSDDHFTVDGTLIDAWASLKSFQLKEGKKDDHDDDPGNPNVDFHGQKRGNATTKARATARRV